MRTFDPSRVALVDSVGKSSFVRGPFPLLSDGIFAYEGISEVLGRDLSKTVMTVVSLIDSTGELPMLSAELKAFDLPRMWGSSYWPPYEQSGYDSSKLWGSSVLGEGGSENKANLMWWPIEGVGQGQDPRVFLTWPRWNLYGLVNQVVGLLSSDVPRTVYVHCSLGADRTGAVVACYMMKARGMTLSEALSFTSSQTPAGSPNRDYIALITAYAAAIGRR